MNERNTNIIKTALYIGLLGLLTLPAIQKKYKIFEEEELKGSIPEYTKPQLTIENWWGGHYQDSAELYLKGTAGFKPSLVRIHNQLHYWLYNVAIANGVIIGNDNYLYEENYIKAHLGWDYVGEIAIQEKVNKVVAISDTLEKLDKSLVVIFAPGKASFYPEYIPEEFHPEQQDTTNYEIYAKLFNQSDVHFIDFNQWFRDMKDISPYPLMPKTGIHWSKYGEVIAIDSMLSYLEVLCDCEYPNFVVDTIHESMEMEETDDDIEDGMNLYFNIPDLKMGYPRFHMEHSGNEAEKRVAVVADSYYWGMYNWGLSGGYFNGGQFWYYNEHVHAEGLESPLQPKDLNTKEEMEKHDVVIILITDANLYKFAFGFIDDMYDSYYPSE